MTRFHARHRPATSLIAAAACLAALLAGCGGHSSSVAPVTPGPVVGLATPTSIAVVTANNAP
jgi:hypothetical protein